jgi:RNA ligase (TIGR02306 family)
MSHFDVCVHRLDEVLPHPNADRLELARVRGYHCVVPKQAFVAGDLVAYIPEAGILPTSLIKELDLTGKLAGPEKNRIKAVMLRGMLSQGLVVAARPGWFEGQSVMADLGVEKFSPGLPPGAEGERYLLEESERLVFDIENIKSFGHLIEDGELVTMTEKVHGVFMAVGAVLPEDARPEHFQSRAYVASKGVLADRQAFIDDPDKPHLYLDAARAQQLREKAINLSNAIGRGVLIMGELFGAGVQDLAYDAKQAPQYRVFAIAVRAKHDDTLPPTPSGWHFADDDALDAMVGMLGLCRVPVLYRGPFSAQALEEATNGRETLSGQEVHIREGVVVLPVKERFSAELPTGRVALKSVSVAYLTRTGGTEFN